VLSRPATALQPRRRRGGALSDDSFARIAITRSTSRASIGAAVFGNEIAAIDAMSHADQRLYADKPERKQVPV